jgi:Kyakuja-Dileera-Zisupton transposase
MNMDYSICQALSYETNPIGSALIIYDVACQWFLNFHRCVQDNPFLSLGPISDLIPAVGKFHLAAHVPSCFAKFSLNFVQGAGQLDGEILETLWSEFNKVSTSARSASKAHRSEIYDDHMRDSNWKKLVDMGKQ